MKHHHYSRISAVPLLFLFCMIWTNCGADTLSVNFIPPLAIPDNNPVGVTRTIVELAPAIQSVESVRISIQTVSSGDHRIAIQTPSGSFLLTDSAAHDGTRLGRSNAPAWYTFVATGGSNFHSSLLATADNEELPNLPAYTAATWLNNPILAGRWSVTITDLAFDNNTVSGNVTAMEVDYMPIPGPPVFYLQPSNQTTFAGSAAAFSPVVSGSAPLSFQWLFNSTNLLGATNSALTLPNVRAGDAGSYSLVASNLAGPAVTSSVVTLTVNCLLNLSANTGGSVTRNPDLPVYVAGSLVTLTATPTNGYGFIRWTGGATGSTNPLAVVMDTNKNITAVFASTALTLASQGVGTITKVPDKPSYDVGEQVSLTATAGRWHVFSGWTDANTNNPRTVTIGESNAYTAVFTPTTPLDTVTIGGVSRLAPVGMPAVAVDGVFILTPSVSARGSATVTLSTTFPGGWLLYTLDGSEPSLSAVLYFGPFTVRKTSVLRTIAYNADFTQSVAADPVSIVILPTLTGLTDGGGSVAIEPPAGDYFSNSLAVVTATPAPGWTLLQWLGDATGANPVVNLSMTRNKTVRAMFGTTLNTTVVGGGSIVTSPVSSWQPYGNQVRLTAVPTTGNYLVFWANAASGATNNPLTFTVTNANPTVTAVFASLGGSQTGALTVIPDGRGQVTLTPSGNRFPLNMNVELQAAPDAGQEFLGWGGDASGTANPLVVTVNSNKVITASFTKRPWLDGEGNPDLLSQDGFRLTLTGEFGAAYEFLGSADFIGWTPLSTVTNTWGTVQFTDAEAGTNTHRVYRAMPLP